MAFRRSRVDQCTLFVMYALLAGFSRAESFNVASGVYGRAFLQCPFCGCINFALSVSYELASARSHRRSGVISDGVAILSSSFLILWNTTCSNVAVFLQLAISTMPVFGCTNYAFAFFEIV